MFQFMQMEHLVGKEGRSRHSAGTRVRVIIVAGKAGGRIKPGRHIASKKGTPLCNLYVSMLDKMGTPVDSFGDSTAPLEIS